MVQNVYVLCMVTFCFFYFASLLLWHNPEELHIWGWLIAVNQWNWDCNLAVKKGLWLSKVVPCIWGTQHLISVQINADLGWYSKDRKRFIQSLFVKFIRYQWINNKSSFFLMIVNSNAADWICTFKSPGIVLQTQFHWSVVSLLKYVKRVKHI